MNAKESLALRRGNTILLEVLMDMVNQFFYENEDGTISHDHISCDEQAIETLINAGMAVETERGAYRLMWDQLADRKRELGLTNAEVMR